MRKYDGPYRVKNYGHVYEVVFRTSALTFEHLNPPAEYDHRSAAHRRAATLNRRWNEIEAKRER